MQPSDVRAKISADHRHLGELLKQAGQYAWRAMDGDASAGAPLRAAVVALDQPLRNHLQSEEDLLPHLFDEIGWGPIQLLDHKVTHAHEREFLTALVGLARDAAGDTRTLALEVAAFVQEMVKEIEREETSLAHPDAVRAGVRT